MKSSFLAFLLLAILLSAVFGCASSTHRTVLEGHYADRAMSQSRAGISVSASVLYETEIEEVFGVRLDLVGIQPVWLKIQNLSAFSYVLFLRSIDPDYFSPYEVAQRSLVLSSKSTRNRYAFLRDREIQRFIPPGGELEGYVYTHLDEGIKSINVHLFGNKKMEAFHIAANVPGLVTDFADFEPSALYQLPLPSLNEEELRNWLESLPCCTFAKDGTFGDPVNLAFVGRFDDVVAALVSQHWDVTAEITGDSLRRIATAFLFGSRYRYAPVSSLYLFGRQQDLSLQKARAAIDERNHIRLWMAPITHNKTPVWVGHVSRDAGIKLSGRFWPPTTHVIDPAVDEARFFMEQDLLYSQHVRKIGLVKGAVGASVELPRFNAEGDPYFTDGLRAVFFIGRRLTPIDNIEVLNWSLPQEMEAFRDSFFEASP